MFCGLNVILRLARRSGVGITPTVYQVGGFSPIELSKPPLHQQTCSSRIWPDGNRWARSGHIFPDIVPAHQISPDLVPVRQMFVDI